MAVYYDDDPAIGRCRDCGDDHWIDRETGRCDDECETCSIAFSDGHLTECVMESLRHSADMRRKAAKESA